MKELRNVWVILFSLFMLLFVLNGCEEENKPPYVRFITPGDSTIFIKGDTVRLSVLAEDEDGMIEEVRFYENENYIGRSDKFPYQNDLDTRDITETINAVKAVAIDDQGKKSADQITVLVESFLPAPDNLTATIMDNESIKIKLTWRDNCSFESGYRIERDEGSGFNEIAELDANSTEYIDTDLSMGYYKYRVFAFYSDRVSDYSNIAECNLDVFISTFGGSLRDYGFSVCEASDGGYVIAGETQSYGNGDSDVWLIKTDARGSELWNQTYGGSDFDAGYSVCKTSDGGFIITGETRSFGNGGFDVWLIKTDALGNELWNRTFGGSDDDYGRDVLEVSDGGFIITGETRSFGNGGFDVWLIETDTQGNELWNQTFGGSDDDYGRFVQEVSNGGFIIAGDTKSFGNGSSDIWLVKTDADGNELWNKTFGGTNTEFGFSVRETFDGGFIITGDTKSSGHGEKDLWLIKTDLNGNELWNQTFGGSDNDYGRSVQETATGAYIITGYTFSFGRGNSDIWLINTDATGRESWSRTFGGEFLDYGMSVLESSDGRYVVTGTLFDDTYNVCLIKIVLPELVIFPE